MREFNTNKDIFRFVNELIELAGNQNDKETVKLLHDAISAGYSSSDVLGELQSAFEIMLKENNKEYISSIQSDIEKAIKTIKKAFKKANKPW